MNPKRIFALLLVLAVVLAGVTLLLQNKVEALPVPEPETSSEEPSTTPEPIYTIDTAALVHEERNDNSIVGKTMFVAGDVVNQRTEMNTDCEVRQQLRAGEAVTVVDHIGDWYKLENGDYIAAEFLVENYQDVIDRFSKNYQDIIITSISQQHTWYWYYGELLGEGKNVTGQPDKTPTPIGLYWVTSRQSDIALMGDDGLHADYFVTFNGQIGYHDAVWNPTDFGGNYYLTAGSHGCVRCEYQLAKVIFDNCRVNYTAVLILP